MRQSIACRTIHARAITRCGRSGGNERSSLPNLVRLLTFPVSRPGTEKGHWRANSGCSSVRRFALRNFPALFLHDAPSQNPSDWLMEASVLSLSKVVAVMHFRVGGKVVQVSGS